MKLPGMVSDEERRETLKNIQRLRAELLKERERIDEELKLMEMVERQHREALNENAG